MKTKAYMPTPMLLASAFAAAYEDDEDLPGRGSPG